MWSMCQKQGDRCNPSDTIAKRGLHMANWPSRLFAPRARHAAKGRLIQSGRFLPRFHYFVSQVGVPLRINSVYSATASGRTCPRVCVSSVRIRPNSIS